MNNTIENFARIYPEYLESVTQLLIDLRKACHGDLEKALIMAVIGDRQFARRVTKTEPRLETLGSTAVAQGPTVNALSISQFTDIPRETVRRKVNSLIELGWVEVDAEGNLKATEKAALELEDGTRAAITFIEKLAAVTRL